MKPIGQNAYLGRCQVVLAIQKTEKHGLKI